jgi:hypothetical protein
MNAGFWFLLNQLFPSYAMRRSMYLFAYYTFLFWRLIEIKAAHKCYFLLWLFTTMTASRATILRFSVIRPPIYLIEWATRTTIKSSATDISRATTTLNLLPTWRFHVFAYRWLWNIANPSLILYIPIIYTRIHHRHTTTPLAMLVLYLIR